MTKKYYTPLLGLVLFLCGVAFGSTSCGDASAEESAEPITDQPDAQLPPGDWRGDPAPDYACEASVTDGRVIAPCIDEGATTTAWATSSDGFIAGTPWEALVNVRAVAVYCEYASIAVVPYSMVQVPVILADGEVAARCEGAHFVHFFAP